MLATTLVNHMVRQSNGTLAAAMVMLLATALSLRGAARGWPVIDVVSIILTLGIAVGIVAVTSFHGVAARYSNDWKVSPAL